MKTIALLALTLLICGLAFNRAQLSYRAANSADQNTKAKVATAKHRAPSSQRAMIAFSSFPINNELRRAGWSAVWCYLPRTRKRIVYHWRGSTSVAARIEELSQNKNGEWAAINGGYFDYNPRFDPRAAPLRQALIGSVGTGRAGHWIHGSPPTRNGQPFARWAFGFQENFGGASDFQIAPMQKLARAKASGRDDWLYNQFWAPPSLQREYSYGLSGLLCLLRDGRAMVWQGKNEIRAAPRGQWNSSSEFGQGYYRRAALGWSSDGKHLFLLVQQHPRSVLETRDLFARYRGKSYVGPGVLLRQLRAAWKKLPPAERPCRESELPTRIENAMLLDGGHSASMMYLRRASGQREERRGSWLNGKFWQPEAPLVPTTIEIIAR
jgi:hypothetical protein